MMKYAVYDSLADLYVHMDLFGVQNILHWGENFTDNVLRLTNDDVTWLLSNEEEVTEFVLWAKELLTFFNTYTIHPRQIWFIPIREDDPDFIEGINWQNG